MRVAIIPARGGSRRIPRKNVKGFCGKPMITWSIEAAQASDCFDKIIVSTDDREIADVAQKCGAEVPFVRPSRLSDDYTGTGPVMRHAIHWLDSHDEKVDFACCIYATAPFLSALDLQSGWDAIRDSGLDYVFSVTSYAFPIQRAIRITERGLVSMCSPEHFSTRSQDLDEVWHDAGQFYWGTAKAWCEEKMIFGQKSKVVKLPRYRVQDIDTVEDWISAEWLFRSMEARGSLE